MQFYSREEHCVLKEGLNGIVAVMVNNLAYLQLKAVLHGATCNVDFSCIIVARKIEQRCDYLSPNQILATHYRVKCCAKKIILGTMSHGV